MLDWAELATVTTQVNHLRGLREAARMKEDAKLVENLANELEQAMTARDALLAQIAQRIGNEALPPISASPRKSLA